MNRAAWVGLALTACGGNVPPRPPTSGLAATPAAVAAVDTPAPAPGRPCVAAHFAAFTGTTAEIYEIGADCTARSVSTIALDDEIFDAAWPRRDQPLALAVGDHDTALASHVVTVAQPLARAARRRSGAAADADRPGADAARARAGRAAPRARRRGAR